MKLQRNHILTLVAVITGSVLIVTACQNIEYPDPSPVATPANTSARVLFVNATDAPALTTLIENGPVGSALASGATTAYLPIATNSSQIRIKGAGGVLGAANLDLSAKQTFLANTSYTVFVTDTINRPQIRNSVGNITDNGGIRFVTVTDPLTQTLTAGAGGVRFFHFAPDAGLPVSTTVTIPPVASLRLSSPTSSSVALANRAYRNVTANTFTSVPAGTYRVDVFTGATAPPTSSTIAPVASTTVNVEATKLYTLYARGLRRTNTLSVGRVQHN